MGPLELRKQSEMHSYRVYNVCGDDSKLNLHTQLAWGATLGHLNDSDSISRMNKTQRLNDNDSIMLKKRKKIS